MRRILIKGLFRALLPLFICDAILMLLDMYFGSKPVSLENPIGWTFEIFSYGILIFVGYIGFLVSRNRSIAILTVTLFWFVWRSLVGILVGVGLALSRGESINSVGFGIELLIVPAIFFPLALFFGWLGTVVASKRLKGNIQSQL